MSNIAIVFPGQGAQKVGMAQDFVLGHPECKSIFDAASKAIDIDMETLCFTENEQLNQTEFTQPAILTAEIAMLEVVKTKLPAPAKTFAGHSLGEYTALVAAGVIPFTDALKIVRRRGALMQDAVPLGKGAMAALISDNIEALGYREIVEKSGAEVANFNSLGQVVISGPREGVEKACADSKTAFPSMSIIPLKVSAPFHCSMMRGIEKEFESYHRSFESHFNTSLATTVLSNFSGTFHTKDTLVHNLVRQISGGVRWVENMRAIAGVSNLIVEVGPARVLSKFFGSIEVTAKAVTDLRSMQKNLVA